MEAQGDFLGEKWIFHLKIDSTKICKEVVVMHHLLVGLKLMVVQGHLREI